MVLSFNLLLFSFFATSPLRCYNNSIVSKPSLLKNSRIFIGVIGGSEATPAIARLAKEVGREIAKRGAALVCGGMGGVMAAACQGAYEEGGLTIGILPGDTRKEANPYVKVPIVTGIGYARNSIVVKSSHAVIAINGSYGTLTEIGFALQCGIPIVGLKTWSPSLKGKPDKNIVTAETAVEAVEKAFSLIESK
jgi:uncharacterized protein (TIGR00725 family)